MSKMIANPGISGVHKSFGKLFAMHRQVLKSQLNI